MSYGIQTTQLKHRSNKWFDWRDLRLAHAILMPGLHGRQASEASRLQIDCPMPLKSKRFVAESRLTRA